MNLQDLKDLDAALLHATNNGTLEHLFSFLHPPVIKRFCDAVREAINDYDEDLNPEPTHPQPKRLEPKHLVMVGNPVDGLTYHGPFQTRDDALAWAEDSAQGDDWWITELYAPSEEKMDDNELTEYLNKTKYSPTS